jgi:hypothetical protein
LEESALQSSASINAQMVTEQAIKTQKQGACGLDERLFDGKRKCNYRCGSRIREAWCGGM